MNPILTTAGALYVYATASVWTNTSTEAGLPDRQGWVDDLDGAEPVDARNDVAPLFHAALPLNEDERDELAEVIDALGATGDYERGMLYAEEGVEHDLTTDETWSYTLHTFVKTVTNHLAGAETDVDPRDYI